jgi:hypothetical protein
MLYITMKPLGMPSSQFAENLLAFYQKHISASRIRLNGSENRLTIKPARSTSQLSAKRKLPGTNRSGVDLYSRR